ncbi:hypothetical protein [Novosphingopyxis sp. YJ-S2-01]|uniref:hypothetical protein n=1 Tax=Novosphingopyxis sp. YJ-S2-01 TaxID=2794021 RepID=UPI0018DE41CC|nr:hypothetical protein [Novosphingopyxis sp. YJ-S2-01]MBH9537973.1 hypothetical protein [Novosphingopyxis sp. YJ-S2-01]
MEGEDQQRQLLRQGRINGLDCFLSGNTFRRERNTLDQSQAAKRCAHVRPALACTEQTGGAGTEMTGKNAGHRQFGEVFFGQPIRHKRRGRVIGAGLSAIIEEAAHRRVAVQAEFLKDGRACCPRTITTGAVNLRFDTDVPQDRFIQQAKLLPLQLGRQVASVAVANRNRFFERWADPRMQLHAHICGPSAAPTG